MYTSRNLAVYLLKCNRLDALTAALKFKGSENRDRRKNERITNEYTIFLNTEGKRGTCG